METAFDLVKRGFAISKDLANKVYNIVDYFYDCNDVFDDDVSGIEYRINTVIIFFVILLAALLIRGRHLYKKALLITGAIS